MNQRMCCPKLEGRIMSAQQAAELIQDGMVVATSGFTLFGHPKIVPQALAERAEQGESIGITLITGASVGDELDGVLSRAGVIRRRYPYQSNPDVRRMANDNRIAYADVHLSQLPAMMRKGVFGSIDIGILEVAAVGPKGELYPTTSLSISPAIVQCAERLILEVNLAQSPHLVGIHDVYDRGRLWGQPIPIVSPEQRVGTTWLDCNTDKIAAIVFTNVPDPGARLMSTKSEHQQMAEHLLKFLKKEIALGRISNPLPPMQSGVGGVANAVLGGLLHSDLEGLTFYSEVIQDAVLDLIDCGKMTCASATGISFTAEARQRFQQRAAHYAEHIILRPVDVSNCGEVIQRLNVIAMNTAVECDIYGNVNSTHVRGTRVLNGIGGSGDFARNAGLSVFFTESTAKGGMVSCIVPFCTHIDHTEHDVQLIITEQGCADLRGLSPKERAQRIIEQCAHPKFRPALRRYLERAEQGHIAHHLETAFQPLEAEEP